jgi:hypothetical protein
MQYKVTVKPLGKKRIYLGLCKISMDKHGSLLVLDEDGIDVRYSAQRCRVECMAREVVLISGVTSKPEYVEVFCMYAEGGK